MVLEEPGKEIKDQPCSENISHMDTSNLQHHSQPVIWLLEVFVFM